MAEGSDLSQTVLGASEEFYDFNCSPCEEDGVHKEAHKYCESCKLYYCKKCLGEHNKFPALKAHVIKDVTSQTLTAPLKAGSKMSNEASHLEPCEHHPEEMIKMYCGEHDLVCCTVCIALDHRDCNDVNYILNIAKGTRTRQDYTIYMKGLAFQRSKYEETKQSILNERKKLCDIKTEIIAEINDYKRELVSRIDELERKSVENVNERFKQITERMDLTLGKVDKLLKKFEKNERDVKHASEAMVFVNMKTTSWLISKADVIDESIEHFEGLSFSLDKRIRAMLAESDGLVLSNHPLKTITTKEYNIVFDDEDDIGDGMADLCLLEDCTLVMTCNHTLKRLDKSFDKLCSLLLQGKCIGVCKTSNPTELAVTLHDRETVQFVKYDDKTMTLTNSFTVGAPCKGIDCNDAYLFVACGGGYYDTVPGHIRQFGMKGHLICTSITDKTCRPVFTSPRLMTLNPLTNDIYITDRDNGMIVLEQGGQVKSHSYNSFLKKGFGVCLTNEKKILVSGYESYNIQQYDEMFRYVGTVLNLRNKKHQPTVIMLDELKRQLIVCLNKHRQIYVYDVEF